VSKKKVNRSKDIKKAICLAWGSLESHLVYTHKGKMTRDESHKFHRECVREYAVIINKLSKLY